MKWWPFCRDRGPNPALQWYFHPNSSRVSLLRLQHCATSARFKTKVFDLQLRDIHERHADLGTDVALTCFGAYASNLERLDVQVDDVIVVSKPILYKRRWLPGRFCLSEICCQPSFRVARCLFELNAALSPHGLVNPEKRFH